VRIGIHYDTGFFPAGRSSREVFDPEQVAFDINAIAHDLYCDAVRVSGGDLARLSAAAESAAEVLTSASWLDGCVRRWPGPRGPVLLEETVLAAGAGRGTRLAFPVDRAAALVAHVVQGATAPAAAGPDQLGRGRLRPAPLHP
jgi:hypothetical protein